MQRVFIQDVGVYAGGPRWPEGTVADYPPGVWRKIASDLGDDLDAFTRPLDPVLDAKQERAEDDRGMNRVVSPRRGRPPKTERADR